MMWLALGCVIAPAQQYAILTAAGGGFLPTSGLVATASIGFTPAVASDRLGNIYIAIQTAVLKLDTAGVLTVVAGRGNPGDSGDGGPATRAQISAPTALAVDPAGNLYIADTGNGVIRKVTTDGIITTIAGSGSGCFCESEGAGDGGPAIAAPLYYPDQLAVDAKGNVYIAEFNTARVRRVSPDGIITTAVGTGGNGGYSGDGGPATKAQIGVPWGLAIDHAGNLFISDVIPEDNDCTAPRIRKVSPDGIITTVAGTGVPGYSGDGGPGLNAQFSSPGQLAVDNLGNLYIPDGWRIRKLSADGTITTIAGDGNQGYSGDNGPSINAEISGTYSGSYGGLATDSAGNLYIADTYNFRVRRISRDGIIVTVAGNGAACCFAGEGENGVVATVATLSTPVGVAIDGVGGFYISDTYSGHIRRVSHGIITTIAGIGNIGGDPGDGGIAPKAFLSYPSGMAVDGSGNLYFADAGGQRIRKINLAGIITTVAGNGTAGFSGDGGLATAAQLNWPKDVALDSAGNLYIADTGDNAIRKVSPTGIISTIAGNGNTGFSGDGGLATNAQLNLPSGVAVDGNGDVYAADTYNFRVRKVDSSGVISTVAGTGVALYSGDGVQATNATLAYPTGLKFDAAGNLFLADWVTVRKITPGGIISTIAGTGILGFTGDGGPAVSGQTGAWGISLDPSGLIYIADPWNNVIRALQPVQ